MGLVKSSLTFSLYTQIITTLVGFVGLLFIVKPKHIILQEILTLETIVQIIEFIFYFWFSYIYTKSVDKNDITRYRYYDWVITTPIMLLTTIVYFEYNNRLDNNRIDSNRLSDNIIDINRLNNNVNNSINNTKPLRLTEFVVDNKNNLFIIFIYNLLMLLVGYLQEIGIIDIWTSSILGFYFLYLTFSKIYTDYASKSNKNLPIFWTMTVLWSLYGFAAMFESKYKNFAYNILDIFSKNFYGLYITYRIYENRIY